MLGLLNTYVHMQSNDQRISSLESVKHEAKGFAFCVRIDTQCVRFDTN
jgi:hypothetical protein